MIEIEYRAEDDRVKYPQDLKCITLEEAFFYSIELDKDISISRDSVRELFKKIATDELIDFELTESATYDNTEHMINLLISLREQGFQISMDDFGTGYSSFSL